MRVLQMNNYHYLRGGSERYYFEISNILQSKNIDVAFFSVHSNKNEDTPFEKYFSDDISFSSEQSLLEKIGTACHMLYSLKNSQKIKALIHDYPCDIAHGHNIYHRVQPAVLKALKSSDVPVLLTLHDYKLICPTYTLYRDGHICEDCIRKSKANIIKHRCTKNSLFHSTFHYCESIIHDALSLYTSNVSFFICPSQFLLEKHLQAGIPQKQLVCIPNFIDPTQFAPQFEGGYVLFAGRLSREKGIKTLLTAMIGMDIPLKIVGDGPLRQELETVVREKDMKQVSFEGYQSGESLANLFKNAAFLVFPSEWYENAPMTILEAYGYGKAVIGADIGGIPEMIVDGETGLLFPPGDSNVLREKIEQLWSNPARIMEMGKAARERVERKYDAETHFEQLMALYEQALG